MDPQCGYHLSGVAVFRGLYPFSFEDRVRFDSVEGFKLSDLSRVLRVKVCRGEVCDDLVRSVLKTSIRVQVGEEVVSLRRFF